MFTKLKLSDTRRNSVCFNKIQSAKVHPQLNKESNPKMTYNSCCLITNKESDNENEHSIYNDPDSFESIENSSSKYFCCFKK